MLIGLICRFFTMLALTGLAFAQHSHYPARSSFSRRVPRPAQDTCTGTCLRQPSIRCTKDAPCYQYVINAVLDGVRDFVPETDAVLQHYARAGIGRDEVVRHGREALAFYKRRYGLQFDMTDEQLTANNQRVASVDGAAELFAFSVSPSARYRVASAYAGDQIQLYNAPMGNGGWAVMTEKSFQSSGELNVTMPPGVGTFYGHYIILPCENQDPANCRNVLNPWRPKDPIVIHYETQKYFRFNQEPHQFTYVDLDLFSDLFGQGYGHGYIPLKDGTRNTVDGWQNMVFPVHPFPYVDVDED